MHDGDIVFIDEQDDAFVFVYDPDAEVVHASRAAQGDFPCSIDVVVADAEVSISLIDRGKRFRAGAIRLSRSGAVNGAVWALLVVFLPESIALGLQAVQCCCVRLFEEPAFLGLVKPFDLALGLGVSRTELAWV